MKYIYNGIFLFQSDQVTSISIELGDDFFQEIDLQNRCLRVFVTNDTTIDELSLIDGFTKVLDSEIPIGTWVLYDYTVINGLKIIPIYEYRKKIFSCYIQEVANMIFDFDTNICVSIKPDITQQDYISLLRERFYILNPEHPVTIANFYSIYLDGGEYTSRDDYSISNQDYMLIDVWNYVYDYQKRQAAVFPFMNVYQYDEDYDSSFHEHLKLININELVPQYSGGLLKTNFWFVDKYTTKQIISTTATFEYQCEDKRIFDARMNDFRQNAFISNIQSSILVELPEGIRREDIDVAYTCCSYDISDVEIQDMQTENTTPRYLYKFKFDVYFICPIYRRLRDMSKILQVIVDVHAKKSNI